MLEGLSPATKELVSWMDLLRLEIEDIEIVGSFGAAVVVEQALAVAAATARRRRQRR